VSATVTYEDREAFAARAGLREQLRELGVEDEVETKALAEYTDSALLFHLDRNFLEPSAGRISAETDAGLVLLEAAGARAQAEQVGEEIAELVGAGRARSDRGRAAQRRSRRAAL